jgi:hypothetical protein
VVGIGAGVGAGYYLGIHSGDRSHGVGPGAGEAEMVGRADDSRSSVLTVLAGGGGSVEGAPSGSASDDEQEAYVDKVAGDDPMRAIAWAQEHSDDGDRDDLYGVIAERWARKDPEGAFVWAESLQRADERGDAYEGVIRGAMESGNESIALALIERIPSGRFRDESLVEAVDVMAETNVGRALELAQQVVDEYSLQKAGQAIGEKMIAGGRVEEAKAMVMNLPYGEMQRRMAYGLVTAMAEEDARLALSWMGEASELFGNSSSQSMAYRIAREFVQEDPQEAIAWGTEVPEGRARDYYYQTVGDAWARMEPEVAGDWLMKAIDVQGFEAVNNLARGVFDEWVEVNQDEPFKFIAGIRDAAAREAAMSMALNELAGENPALAAERLADWGTADLKQAQTISQRLMGNWMQRDAAAASQWLNGLPSGQVKDSAISTMLQTVIREDKDYSGARAWVNEVESESMRNSLTRQIEYGEDPAAARAKEKAKKLGKEIKIKTGANGQTYIVR